MPAVFALAALLAVCAAFAVPFVIIITAVVTIGVLSLIGMAIKHVFEEIAIFLDNPIVKWILAIVAVGAAHLLLGIPLLMAALIAAAFFALTWLASKGDDFLNNLHPAWQYLIGAVIVTLVVRSYLQDRRRSPSAQPTADSPRAEDVASHSIATPIERLAATRPVVRRFATIGVGLEDLTPASTSIARLAPGWGAWVFQVYPGGPAYAANISPGDIIIAVSNHKVQGGRDALKVIADTAIGQPINVDILRRGRLYTAQPRTIEAVSGP
jgi:membrane-associated protease RseP (regulator of RpoE activity)